MTAHHLKTWPQHFQSIADGSKTYELRRDDRGYTVGDLLVLHEFDPVTGRHTGREHHTRITHILRDSPGFGLQPGHAILSITPPAAPGSTPR